METLGPDPGSSPSMTRRDLLRAGLVAGAGLSVAVALAPRRVQAQPPKRGGIVDIQRYAAEQQYYVSLYSVGITASWQPYVKHYAPNPSFDYGHRAAALWLDQ